jgi:hypothetical protein
MAMSYPFSKRRCRDPHTQSTLLRLCRGAACASTPAPACSMKWIDNRKTLDHLAVTHVFGIEYGSGNLQRSGDN